MKIYIPTLGRHNKQITFNNLPNFIQEKTILVVQPHEKDLYSDYPILILPEDNIGISRTRKWIIDNNLNGIDRIVPIGPKPRNLDKDFDYPEQTMNQLIKWSKMNIIDDYPQDVKAVADFADPSENIEARARAYLAINCGHCHSPLGSASSTGLYLNYGEKRPKQLGILKPPVAAGRGSGGLNYSIVPGDPDASILLFRMISDDPAIMMPESGRSIIHQEAVALINDWIEAMEGEAR